MVGFILLCGLAVCVTLASEVSSASEMLFSVNFETTFTSLNWNPLMKFGIW